MKTSDYHRLQLGLLQGPVHCSAYGGAWALARGKKRCHGQVQQVRVARTEDQNATPIGLYRGGKFFAIHSDHLNTPRLITDDTNKAVWQWPYSAFGDNKPTGILKATTNPNNAYTQDPTTNARLQATNPNIAYNPRFAGQYFDSETGLHQNFFRSYRPQDGRYTQNDPIGMDGGWNRIGYQNLKHHHQQQRQPRAR